MAPTQRFYAGATSQTTITGAISSSATTLTVASAVGFPGSTPFAIVLDVGLSSEEKMLVTNVASTTFTVTRGFDGTTGVAHNSGATVNHVFTAQDATDFSGHIFTTSEDDHTQYTKVGTITRGIGSVTNVTAVTVTGTTSATNLQAITFPANSLLAGFYATGFSTFAQGGGGSPSSTVTVKFAGQTLANNFTMTSIFSSALATVYLTVVVGGAAGQVNATVIVSNSQGGSFVVGGAVLSGIDLTSSQVLQFVTTNGDTGTSITQQVLTSTVHNV